MRGDFSIDYPFGFLFGKLSKRDSLLIKIIHYIKQEQLENVNFQNFIISLERAKYEQEQKLLIKRIKEYWQRGIIDHISIVKYKTNYSYLNKLSFTRYKKYHQINYSMLKEETSIFNFSCEEYILLQIVELLYTYYNHTIRRFDIPACNNLEKLYLSKGISLRDIDIQYKKYGLITIDENIEISDSNVLKVYDKRIDSYILIKEIPESLLNLFRELKIKQLISSLALRPDYNLAGEGFLDLSLALEELERGELFSFEKLGTPSITKLYTENYEDYLWVNIDGNNIIFEEILDDFEVYNEFIVTQVLHLQYRLNEKISFITHLDHEYIFYSIDEYEKRITDYSQKGNAKKRFKTFKIDNSQLPFIVSGDFILYYILDKYFTKKELLNEYFEKVIQT
jgi:hypothetical protein